MTTPTTVNIRLQLRADTAANWTAANPILLANELGRETDTGKFKVGDGSTAWSSLAYQPWGSLITDADIAAGAEIAVSKLANGTANQVLVTDGTDVSWSDDLTLAGNLTVNGTTTTVNTETLVVEDKNIELGVVGTPTDLTADGGGITLKGTTDKTINWVDSTDAWTSSERFSVPLGSAASPSLTFTGDENTGIYSPGEDQVALSTGGTGRLFVDASGRVLINGSTARTNILTTSTVGFQLEGTSFDTSNLVSIRNSSDVGSANLILGKTRGSTVGSTTAVQSGDQLGVIRFTGSDGTTFLAGSTIQSHADGTMGAGVMPGYLAFSTTPTGAGGPSERLRITSDGKVGVGTSSPSQNLHVNSGGNTVLLVSSSFSGSPETAVQIDTVGDTSRGNVYFSKSGSNRGSIKYNHSATGASESLSFNVSGGTDKLTITGAGNVGIGTTSPGARLQVAGDAIIQDNLTIASTSTEGGQITINDPSNAASLYIDVFDTLSPRIFSVTNNVQFQYGQLAGTGGILRFFTAGLERFRCDSSGRLLVGTSSSRAIGSGTAAVIQAETTASLNLALTANRNDGFGSFLCLGKSRGTAAGGTTIVNSGDALGAIRFAGADGVDLESIGAEIKAEVDGTPGANDMPGRLVFSTTADGASSPTERMRIQAGGGVMTYTDFSTALNMTVAAAASATDRAIDLKYSGTGVNSGTRSFQVTTNGDVKNTNNSYGAISDIKLKENIVDANSQWDDIKALRPVNYNFKEGQTHTQLGLIAQEVELVSPGLVSESPDRDEDGNDLGTTTKSVNYSVLYMKAVKALQEAMERIETLEAKVAALETP